MPHQNLNLASKLFKECFCFLQRASHTFHLLLWSCHLNRQDPSTVLASASARQITLDEYLKICCCWVFELKGVYEGAAGADYCDPTRENTTIPPHGKFHIKQWKHNPDTGRAFVHRRMESRMGGRVSVRMGVTQSGSQMDIVRLLVKRKLCGQMLWVLFSGTLASIGLEHIYVFWSIFGGKLWRLRVCFTNFMQKNLFKNPAMKAFPPSNNLGPGALDELIRNWTWLRHIGLFWNQACRYKFLQLVGLFPSAHMGQAVGRLRARGTTEQ